MFNHLHPNYLGIPQSAIDFSQMLLACSLSTIVVCVLLYFINMHALKKLTTPLISLSIGLILGLCFLHGLPEIFTYDVDPKHIFAILLGGILLFFLLEKFGVFRHDHHHEGDGHTHATGFNQKMAGHLGASILFGSSVHHFADGILIGSAFLHSNAMGWMMATSILIHETPQLIADFIIFKHANLSKKRLFLYGAILSGAVLLGGSLSWMFIVEVKTYLPYILTLGYSSLIYIAISDLLPQIHQHHTRSEWMTQISLITCGLAFMFVLNQYVHHAHEGHDEVSTSTQHQH